MRTREWMRELCCLDLDRPNINAPYRTQYEGEDWDCATNGHGILLMRGPCRFEARADDSPPPVTKVFSGCFGGTARRVDLEALRDWAAPTELIAGGNFCEMCGDPPDHLREGCPSRLFGVRVNRRLAWQFLRYLRNPIGDGAVWAGTVWIRNPTDPITIAPTEEPRPWLLMLMPLRDDGDPDDGKFDLTLASEPVP